MLNYFQYFQKVSILFSLLFILVVGWGSGVVAALSDSYVQLFFYICFSVNNPFSRF